VGQDDHFLRLSVIVGYY